MATRSRRATAGKPRRILITLLVLIIALYVAIAGTTAWGSPKGKWVPQLGLDLEGGRQITLQPIVGKGETVSSGQLDQAVDIIRNRVNGNGVTEAQVTTAGSGNNGLIVVSLPGDPSQATLNALAQSSQLAFRAVIEEQAVTPAAATPTPSSSSSASPSASGSASPSASSSASPSAKASASASPTPSSTSSSAKGANDVIPQAFKAASSSPSPTSTASSTKAAASGSSADPSASASATPSATPSPQRTLQGLTAPAATPTSPSDTTWASQPVDNIWVVNGLATAGETYAQLYSAYPCTDTATQSAEQWRQIAAQAPLSQPDVMCDATGTTKYLMGPSEVNGKEVTNATYGQTTNQAGNLTGTVAVNLTFDSKGASAFSKVTERLMGFEQGSAQNAFAITIDGTVISAPQTQSAITNGTAQITGNFTESSARTLANQLKYGALPFSFKELTSEQVSPQVGSDQLQKALLAGLAGLVLVVLYSMAQYRVLGLVTVASLGVAAILSYGAVTLLGFTSGFRLTMAGVAGLIVAIGITADSFIVYFERVRDEVRSGRPLRAAVETGWLRARRTIIISDAVNFLASAVLYILSEDNVKAFAFTLGLSTVIDIVVVMMFTHPTLTLLARTKFFGGGHKWSGFDPDRLGAGGVTYAGRGRVTIADRKAGAESASTTSAVTEGGHA
ncbi:protein translocase subunit SecD [Rudaeicoccus suwonensis]|uniref:Protein translocase subunit SecD n=1 Tax=Rudaeicoccus suwonensis TaxID=657409 RepID=A0A561EB92_9MICO|nr:protein translocase subunit SecD [Rudaeicoccus suwonensis]TWE12880.1 preprotein translocase subunit SecD [Rudaeicoccus suwonensis]